MRLREEFRLKLGRAVNLEGLKQQREQVRQHVAQLETQLPSKAEMDALLSDINQAGVGRGAQLMLFSTGVGNSYVSLLAPTIKLSANPDAALRLREQLDFDASDVFRGMRTLDDAAQDLVALVVDIASGSLTWGEVLGEGDEVVSRMAEAL